jgi:CHAD domain-containing protein
VALDNPPEALDAETLAAPNGRAAVVADPRTFELAQGELLPTGLRRIGRGQLDTALELLAPAEGGLSEHAVHETRKSLKRLRALVRLLCEELGAASYTRENEALRDARRRLAGARDAEVVLATLDALCERNRRPLAGHDLAALRAELESQRAAAVAQTAATAGVAEQLRSELSDARARVGRWRFEHEDFAVVEPGLERIYRQGRRRYRVARRQPSGEHLHEWRKSVKYLRHAAEILVPADPKRMRNIARRADRLGETLGDEHDLAVLEAIVVDRGPALLDKHSAKRVRSAIARRRAKLRGRALRIGGKLYDRPPRRFVRTIARGWHRRAATD